MKLLLCFAVLALSAFLNHGFHVKNGVKVHNNQLKSTQLNLFGKKAVVAEVVQKTVSTGKRARLMQFITGKKAVASSVAGTVASPATACTNSGICGGLASLKVKFASILTSFIGFQPLTS